MGVPLVPSTSQIEAQLEAMLAKSADERVLGMRSSMPHAWPETIQARGKPFRLVWCETGPELREQLASLEDDPEARKHCTQMSAQTPATGLAAAGRPPSSFVHPH